MLEIAEVGAQVSRAEYEKALPRLRVDLINAQFQLRGADFPVMVVLSGDDREGVSEVLNLLHQWMDARYLDAHFFGRRRDEEKGYPRFWRYWRVLPGKGEIGIYAGGYALGLLADQLTGENGDGEAARRLEHARRMEQTLVDDGTLLLKIWLHLPPKERDKRLAEARQKPESTRLDEIDLHLYERYAEAEPLIEALLRRTSTAAAPWCLVESTDLRHRNLTVAREIHDALCHRLASPEPTAPPAPPPSAPRRVSILSSVELDATLSKDEYKSRLEELQTKLWDLGLRCREQQLGSALVFEGWDAAGKGGVIRRITRAMDVQDYRVMPVAAPTPEELAHHYLWRFWRRLPRAGRMLICDRSWYGRVLVERVEGLAQPHEWGRAYEEINDFEEQLVGDGVLVLKFWLHIDPDTQLERFAAREKTPYKKYKLTDDDHRNRNKWSEYEAAVEDMVGRTSTDLAPWHLIPANDKRYSRTRVLETVCTSIEKALGERD
ncbi:MAG: polyphosphate:AMP phosphotransferase [Myxococcota bacterium]|nr:polyphosphate:AMP phosphotransferase [Myxococcota bacterium]